MAKDSCASVAKTAEMQAAEALGSWLEDGVGSARDATVLQSMRVAGVRTSFEESSASRWSQYSGSFPNLVMI